MQSKTKKGATSLITTMFFTLLAGILVLSFVSIMLTNINESTNYNLSQSAYDAALAGVEDAKIALLLYGDCISRGDLNSARCKKVVESLSTVAGHVDGEGHAIDYDPEDDCDIVRRALGRAEGENETPIRTDNTTYGTSGDNRIDSTFDMAYTCVKVTSKVPDYLGTISKDSDMKVIPLRTESAIKDPSQDPNAGYSPINRIRIEWFSNKNFSDIIDNGMANLYAGSGSPISSSIQFTTNKTRSTSITSGLNKFQSSSYLPPTLSVGLIQAGKTFRLSSFNVNSGTSTNRGRMILRAVGGRTDTPTLIQNTATEGFAASAMAGSTNYTSRFSSNYNADNSPRDVKCYTKDTIGDHAYACSVEIDLPQAVGYDSHNNLVSTRPSDILRYLTLSAPYSRPDIAFSVTMFACTNLDPAHRDTCETVDFVGVQSRVDSTGRANDLFRRIEARVELVDVGYPYPKYALGAYGNDGGNIIKNYSASYNCYNITNGKAAPCGEDGVEDYGSDGEGGGFYE